MASAINLDEDRAACAEMGFLSVACTTCQTIKDIVADEDLSGECLQCCHETKRAKKKYASARLVYDPRLLRGDQELRGFVEERASNHPALKLEPTLYAKPVLLMSEEGARASDADTVSIGRWKLDSIAGYLEEHL